MNELIKDPSGKVCNAKIMYNITVITCLIKLIISGMSVGGWSGGEVDYSGLALIMGAAGSVYWGRNKTKADKYV